MFCCVLLGRWLPVLLSSAVFVTALLCLYWSTEISHYEPLFFFFQHLNLLQHCPLEGTSSDCVNILFHIYINYISITLYSVLLPCSEEDAPVKSSCLLPVRRWDRRQGYVNCLLPLSERMERVLLAFSWVVSEIAFREGVKLIRECCCPNSSRFSTVMDSIWCGESSSMVQRVQLAAGVLKQTMEPR